LRLRSSVAFSSPSCCSRCVKRDEHRRAGRHLRHLEEIASVTNVAGLTGHIGSEDWSVHGRGLERVLRQDSRIRCLRRSGARPDAQVTWSIAMEHFLPGASSWPSWRSNPPKALALTSAVEPGAKSKERLVVWGGRPAFPKLAMTIRSRTQRPSCHEGGMIGPQEGEQ
jgi:hypothetical protein